MTLQQKMLAKQSKKGFTLVELVVVIAILAILAAIAIPAVIGIINSASESQGASDASTLNSACKTFYAGIQSGTINKASKDSSGAAVTVKDACAYSGLYTGKMNGQNADDALADFYVVADGTIKFAVDKIPDSDTAKIQLKGLTFDTTLKAIYVEKAS